MENTSLRPLETASRKWLEENNVANFAWSSQARGFFVRGDHEFTEDAELVRCWYSDDNFARLARWPQHETTNETTSSKQFGPNFHPGSLLK